VTTSKELLSASATEIASAIRNHMVSAVEVLDMHLDRIAEMNPRINAFVTLAEDHARAAAVKADQIVARRQELTPLHGVPFSVKDIIATKDIRTTAGSLLLADFVPTRGAPAVERLRRAGAVLIGKSNCPEFALDLHTKNRLVGNTWNPWNQQFTSGGSSGGDSAAVASGFVAFGIGTDYGGSIRWPAHCTGLASLRPTVGLVPATGQLPYTLAGALPPPNSMSLQGRLQTIAPIARSVRDLWVIAELMAGPDGRDEQAVPVIPIQPDTVDIRDLRCVWFESEGSYPVRADLIAVVERAAECLRSLGVEVLHIRPPGLEKAEGIFAPMRRADGLDDHMKLAAGREEELTDVIRAWFAGSTSSTVADYRRLAADRDALRAEILEFMETHPILLLPVASIPTYRPDLQPSMESFEVEGVQIPYLNVLTCCRAISLLGVPVAVVTCGSSEEGLPAGVQVVGRPFADHQVLAVAAALEEGFGRWSPPAEGGDSLR
jgi:Asp-tRNA(Asn)/Glu-tRNA(Gln) amidotransferase A subunit family amidase